MSALNVRRDDARGMGERGWTTTLLAAVVPPLIAFAAERAGLWSFAPWLVFVAAVTISSWAGGLRSGLVATALSVMIAWWYLVPEGRSFTTTDPDHYKAATIFVAIGAGISLVHDRLRRTKREAAQSQFLFQAVIDHSPVIIEIKDLEGRLLMFNKKLGKGLGLTDEQLRGRTAHDLLPAPIADRRKAIDERVITTGEPVVVEETIEGVDGPHVYLATVFALRGVDGRLFGVCWIETEITRRKRTQEALERTAYDLNEAQRVAHMGNWRWDRRTGAVTWSDELYRIHGRDSNLPPPRYAELPTLFTPESLERIEVAIRRMVRHGEAHELELEAILPDGSTRWVMVRGEALRDAAGAIVGARGTTQDISKQKEQQRLKEEWTSVIAHDLRQPIGVIKMSAQLLGEMQRGKMVEKESSITDRILNAANVLARMVDDLLDVSRIEAHRLSLDQRWMNARALVEETTQRLSHLAVDTKLEVDCKHVTTSVFVDVGRFEQILGNLISNAVKYGERNSRVTVHAKQRGNEVEVAVTNKGRGIAAEDIPRLFTRFGRAKSTREGRTPGLGLGLYISRGLVEAHGGRMWVDSHPGETTTFYFTLPSRDALKAVA